MKMPILVTGGTGTLGRLVVQRLRDAGRKVRVFSRHGRAGALDSGQDGVEFVTGDLATGEGIAAAARGTEIIVHCAGSAKGDEDKARHVTQAAKRVGTRHLLNISVVGCDQIPLAGRLDRAIFGYFGSKFVSERIIADSGVPWTTMRATQFHDLILMTARAMSKLPVIPVPTGFRFQPVDAGEVADRLVELAFGSPGGLVPDVAGPRVYDLAALVRSYLRVRRKHRLMVPIWLPGKAARAVRAGANLAQDRAVGRRTWEDFLAAQAGRM